MLSLPRLFAGDYADGTLEQMLLSRHRRCVSWPARWLAHWLLTGLPLIAARAASSALQYGMRGDASRVLAVALLLGTPILSLLGAIGAALTLGAARRRRAAACSCCRCTCRC